MGRARSSSADRRTEALSALVDDDGSGTFVLLERIRRQRKAIEDDERRWRVSSTAPSLVAT